MKRMTCFSLSFADELPCLHELTRHRAPRTRAIHPRLICGTAPQPRPSSTPKTSPVLRAEPQLILITNTPSDPPRNKNISPAANRNIGRSFLPNGSIDNDQVHFQKIATSSVGSASAGTSRNGPPEDGKGSAGPCKLFELAKFLAHHPTSSAGVLVLDQVRFTERSESEQGQPQDFMNGKSVILVPYSSFIEPACEEGLRQLENAGHAVWRISGFTDISRGRSQLATDALAAGFDELIWIDSDVVFDPKDVARLRGHGKSIVGGIYPIKGQRRIACTLLEGEAQVRFGEGGGLIPVRHIAAGFLYTRREVYATIQKVHALPRCVSQTPNGLIPFFAPHWVPVAPESDQFIYLSEDFAFCERCQQCKIEVFADTSIRLYHVGKYGYSWEDAGGALARYRDYLFSVTRSSPSPKSD